MNQDRNLNILTHNADILFNDLVVFIQNSNIEYIDKHNNLSVDNDGKLFIIGKFNLIGRLIKWFFNRDGFIDNQVNQIVLQTLKDINRHNSDHAGQTLKMIYLTIKSRQVFFNTDYYSSHYPAYYLSDRILACTRFQTTEIKNILEEIKKNDYVDATGSNRAAPNQDPKVWAWDEWDQRFGDSQ